MNRKLGARVATFAIALSALISFPAAASATPISFNFNVDQEGWGASQNSGTLFANAVWCAGTICATDMVADGASGNFVFGSPNIMGGIGGNYGGAVSFDLNSTQAPTVGPEVTIEALTGDAVRRVLPEVGSIGETHFSTPLTEAGWEFCPFGMACTGQATQSEFQGVLGSPLFMKLMVDVVQGMTTEQYALDHVLISDPPVATPPETPPSTTPPAALTGTPTGQRARALKKCGKIKDKPKRKKCKKRARRLPV